MLTYVEFVIVLIVAIVFLKPKDIIYLLSFLKDLITKFKHLLYIGKTEINKVIEETKINDLKEESKKLLNKQQLNDSKKILDTTKKNIQNEVASLYKSANLNYNLDNILKNNNSSSPTENNNSPNSK